MTLNNEWITIKDAMALLQVTSRTTLYKYAMKYNIRATKPLGKVYFNYSDIIAVMTNNAIQMGL